ncbi:aminotransferase class I/II-fold pyridoxal phosphate-dependent enzyme [Mycolicibacterium rufum]|uniref:Aminotransferase class I/II-fold pyridoxal phosphate-dependent enzyme n=1 Tax=Mycolicibacterium rufum TaxID=318424 RepID=A0A9X2YBA2_9MYCO|nr:aminotransferase class I/II-fold pyridoxal phosphate-dependent enzyme [Mycolicibacterium rufum]KGI70665.1 aminotransferase [Mycolicibacterium rufum]MCV7070063.1 aminotransferase class I/II-fold pyridoxal phosphate-dependent enzyme [Mycolicibacterium rufum]ULP37900.1 aminotransferase class I/II-fold pyridoxal phosphate-dependent enzyme [Mycolicibacterium rufum]
MALRDAAAAAVLPDAVNPFALSLNESPFPPLPAVRAAVRASLDSLNRYPEFLPHRLRSVIAGRLGTAVDQVVVGEGATGVLLQVLHALTGPGDTLVTSTPTFDGYPILARMARLRPVTIPLDRHGHHDLDAMADAAVGARVVVVCRPHNPTGTVEQVGALERFLRRVPADTVVLLDEAYAEFLAPDLRLDAVDLVRRFGNVVVVRTFSKAYGLAGLRIGYGFCAPALGRALWTMQLPFGVSLPALAAVVASYEAESQLRHRIRTITAERRRLQMRLRAMGVYTTDAQANFVYLPGAEMRWSDAFDGSGLMVRRYDDGGVRITVGSRASTRAVIRTVAAGMR